MIQLARHLYPDSQGAVFARDEGARRFALEMGETWVGDTTDQSLENLDATIGTAPVWKPVVEAFKNLRPNGRLVINAIRKVDSDKESLLELSYHDHLWREREIKTFANVLVID